MSFKKIINVLFFCVAEFFLSLPLFAASFSDNSSEEYFFNLPKDDKTLVILETPTLHDLNPQTTSYTSDSAILVNLYSGLFCNHPQTLAVEPDIAIDYRISRDKKRITLTLRDDAYFSNGEKINAEAVKKSFIMLLSNPNAPYVSLLDIIKGAEDFRKGKGSVDKVGINVLEENKISFKLEAPANYFLSILCHTAFSIVHEDKNVFSGPFVLSYEKEGEILLEKNKHYWDADKVEIEKAYFIQCDDVELSTMLCNSGIVDWVCSGAIVESKLLNKKSIQTAMEFGTGYLFFKFGDSENTAENKSDSKKTALSGNEKIWSKKEFRNAVMEAFPWDIIREDYIFPATTLIVPLTGYPMVDGVSYTDKYEAQLLMNEAREKYGIPEDETLILNIALSKDAISDKKKAFIIDALSPLGINAKFTEYASSEYLRNIKNIPADMLMYIWIGDFADPLAFLELFKGNSSLNDSNYNNEKFNELIQKAAESNLQERYNLLSEAESLLFDESVVFPLFHNVSVNIIDLDEIKGWSNNAFDFHPIKYIIKQPVIKKLPNIAKNN